MAKYDENTIDRIMDMYLKEEKSGQTIAKELGIPRSTVYFYIQKHTGYDSLDFNKRNFRFLINRSKHLESVVAVLQESQCSANDPLKMKLKELERLSGGEYNVHVLCEALKVPRGTYYNHMLRGKGDDVWYKRRRVELKEAISQVFSESQQRYGAPKITAVLRDRGIRTTPELVKELMIEMGLSCVRQEAKALYKKTQIHNHNLVQKRFRTNAPNEIWVSDVTCLKVNDHYYYVCVVLDLFSRRVLSYSISYRNSTALIKKAFLSAYDDRRPKEEVIFHSDYAEKNTMPKNCRSFAARRTDPSFFGIVLLLIQRVKNLSHRLFLPDFFFTYDPICRLVHCFTHHLKSRKCIKSRSCGHAFMS